MRLMQMRPEDIGRRLREARERRGFASAAAAARRFNWNVTSYQQAENGTRPPPRDKAAEYATKFKVSLEWLLTGAVKREDIHPEVVPLLGRVSAGGVVTIHSRERPREDVTAPPQATETTRALQVLGDSMRQIAHDGWLLYYDDASRAITEEKLGKLCVVGLADGRVMVKTIRAGSKSKHFHLTSPDTDPLFDQKVDWAAEVLWIKPR